MGLPHCLICVVLTFVLAIVGVTRSYMSHILFRNFLRAGFNSKLKFSFY